MAKLTGTNPDQVPTNADLGTMAYQDKDNVNVGSFTSNGIDDNATSTAMTLDSSGNLLVGKTTTGSSYVGSEMRDGTSGYTATFTGNDASNAILSIMRNNGDGELIRLRNSSGNPVGTIRTYSDGIVVGNSNSSAYANLRYTNDQVFPCTTTGGANDNAIDLGKSTSRFQDLYLSGGVYLGGTGSANKLDDYEEGTWTPTIEGSTTNPSGLSYAIQDGRYRKIGGAVYISFRVRFSYTTSTGSGSLYIAGLPFTAANHIQPKSTLQQDFLSFTGFEYLEMSAVQNNTVIGIAKNRSGNSASSVVVSDAAAGTTDINGGIFYFV